MKAQEIKVKHIYYVDFEPTKKGELGNRHLAVVLKKNNDNITFVTIPLTSKESGSGVNKVNLGKLECLPENLRQNESFAVYDQIRTVNAGRFYKLIENKAYIDVELPDEKFSLLFECILRDLMFDLDNREKENICNKLYKEYSCKKE